MKRPGHRFKVASEVGERWLHAHGVKTTRLGLLERAWEKLFGHRKRHFDMTAVHRGVLLVRVSSPVVGSELRMNKESIVRDLNKELDASWIKDIRISNA